MNKKKLLLVIIALLPVAASAEEYTEYLQQSWRSLFNVANSFIWVLGIMPVVLALFAAYRAKKDLMTEQSNGNAGTDTKGGMVDTKIIKVYITYIVVTVISLYIIYGVFGYVYAGAEAFGTTWEKLVWDLWRGWLGN